MVSACDGDTTPATTGTPPGPQTGTFIITASGGVPALEGYDFPFTKEGFVDGWEVKLTSVLVTVDRITLAENPDASVSDAATTGAVVAEVDGPFAIDLHKGGPLTGKGGPTEKAVQIAAIDRQNKNGDKPFEASKRYAFGYDVVPAAESAKLVNLDATAVADYAMMKQKGYTVLYVGTATFKGTSCIPVDPEFAKLPKVVDFKLGFKAPTSYLNCQNPDNDKTKHLGTEEFQRGLMVKANQAVTAQISLHLIHPFWESFVHDSAAHFDQIAAPYVGATGTPTAQLEDLNGINPKQIKDRDGNPLPWRTCTKDYTPPSAGTMGFDSGSIPIDPLLDATKSIRDLYDFTTYNQSSQGHLNAGGLCVVKRSYPSP
jgi:hypothetical protein